MSEGDRTQGNRSEYVVLARRYRPAQFEQVIGQQHVTRTLQNAIRAGRVHHAYLFTGSRGVGKTTVARILARALNHPDGPTPTPPLDLPGEEVSTVDVIEIDGASHTGVDDVRELRESVRYLPSTSRYKIYIIDEVHMLSTSAFNALLKTLEEPPPHVIFVFATTEPHKIPATILSRCQRFDFKRVPTPVLVAHAQRLLEQEGIAVDVAGLGLIARAAEGGVRDSLSLLDQVIAYTAGGEGPVSASQVAEVLGLADRRTLFALSAALLERNAAAALEVVEGVFRNGIDLSQFAQAFLGHLRDLVVVASCEQPLPLLDATEAELADLQSQAQAAALPLLQQYFDRFAHAAEEIARSSFPRLLLEMVLIELVHSEPLLPLGDLLERLELLESRLAQGGVAGSGSGGAGGARARAPVPSGRVPLTFEVPKPRRADAAEPAAVAARAAQGPGGVAASFETRAAEPDRSDNAAAARGSQAPAALARTASTAAPASAGEIFRGPGGNGASAPRPSGAVPGGPIVGGERIARWKKLLERLPGPHTAMFAAGRLMRWDDNEVELAYQRGSFELQCADDRLRRETFEERCAQALGRPLRVVVRPLSDEELASPEMAQISAIQAEERRQSERAEVLRNEAEHHPITQAFIETFDARISRISTEADNGHR